MLKKITAIILCLSASLMFYSCNGKNNSVGNEETTADSVSEILTETNSVESSSAPDETPTSEVFDTTDNETVTDVSVPETSSVSPSDWSTAEIIDTYKKAAAKSNSSVKSEQIITMKDFSINNGQYENVIDFVMPIMSKLLANNSTEKDGITGGYQNLSEADIASAKAYASGENTVIEMVLKNQTGGPRDDAMSGSVGHAITAVGDIGVITDQINDLGIAIEISDKDTKINYTNATVKVLIDKKGNIIKGTWKYTVDINLNNYKVGKSTVETTSVVMDNVITVNGGF